jgi:formylglycine-generating enzyme required for sulfatase activity/predicted Ser/Thr protein kinase
LTDEALALLIDDQLPPVDRSALHRHAAECAECRALLVEIGWALDEAGSSATTVPGWGTPPPPAVDEGRWTLPREFDGLRLERELGRGAMGVVYLAHDTALDRRVAVKLVPSEDPRPATLERLEMEARAMARLKHPNVVTVFRTGRIDGRPYIVSEYVEGRSLAELPLPVPWRHAVSMGLDLARGLAAVHDRGLLHRDLKPSNALLSRSGEVKLLDFGLAERFDPNAPPHAGIAARAGTPRYMAPEVLSRRMPASPRSDLYSLGLVLWELCTGVRPDPTSAALAGELPEGMDPDFAALIQRCLEPDPDRRWASAAAVAEALERLAASTPAPLAQGNPYRGLAPFEAEHAAAFFGRDGDVAAVIERLERQSLVLVAGDSGAGKSSLCRAGVLPRVASGALGRELATVTLLPGHRPLDAFAAALAPLLGWSEHALARVSAAEPGPVGALLRTRHRERGGLLLFVDQMEELVTVAEPSQADVLAALLAELALPATGVRVLAAVRGDLLTRVGALPGLGPLVDRSLYLLRPMTSGNVREAVVRPARSRGVVFESEELVQRLVASAAGDARRLPLLQFALAELWEHRDVAAGRITGEALDGLGGVRGALSRHADGVLARLGEAQRLAARPILLQLVGAATTRVERSEDELGPSAEGRAALEALVEGRLVQVRMVAGRPRYQLAHDWLIDHWLTLREWLDEDIGQRALRQRVAAAAAEWERLGRAPDSLWRERQLEEARSVSLRTLGPGEQAFLRASRDRARRRRRGRFLAGLGALFGVAATASGLLAREWMEASRWLEAARGSRELGDAARVEACQLRAEVLPLYDGPKAAAPAPHGATPRQGAGAPVGLGRAEEAGEAAEQAAWDAAEARWSRALARAKEAEARYGAAERSIDHALDRSLGRNAARSALMDLTYQRLLLAECFHPEGRLDEDVRSLQDRFDDPRWRERVAQPALLSVEVDPPGARVVLERYAGEDGALRLERAPEVAEAARMPLRDVALAEGSYRVRAVHPGFEEAVLPLLLGRGQREMVRLPLAPEGSVPAGFVYVPPGCFLSGGGGPEIIRGGFFRSAPLHQFCMKEGYLIGRYEVTFGDWLSYLATLPAGAPERSVLDSPRFSEAGAVSLREARGGWVFSFFRSRTPLLEAREGEPVRYPKRDRRAEADWRRFPLSGVALEDLQGYLAWLDRTAALPGARLCTEYEWERAARGADGRSYPHGSRLLPDDANVDATYGREPRSFGPDMVGAHPASVSPFGLLDAVGNVFELTRTITPGMGLVVLRGGSWYHDAPSVNLENRAAAELALRNVLGGFRVCAPFAAAGAGAARHP